MSTGEQGVKNCCKVSEQVGKSKPVVVFTFLEVGAAKPRTQSWTETSWATGKHWICRQMALSKSGLSRLLSTLPLLAYNFIAIPYTGDYAHIQILTKKNHSTISQISLERHFLRKTFKRKVLKTVL